MSTHVHNIVPGRKPGTERCKECSWTYPCSDECGHSDCVALKGKLPKCYYCAKRVEGPKGEDWTPWVVRGHTRAVHYQCRDKVLDAKAQGDQNQPQQVQEDQEETPCGE